jgi:hypothetical protein
MEHYRIFWAGMQAARGCGLEAVLRLVPVEESEEPREDCAENGSFEGREELGPGEVAVQHVFEEEVEEGVGDEPGEEEASGWFGFHGRFFFLRLV